MNLETSDLLRFNLIETVRLFNRWQKNGYFIESDGFICAAGTTDFPFGYANVSVRVDTAVDPDLAIGKGLSFFKGLNRSFTLMINGKPDADLEEAAIRTGLVVYEDSPWMILNNRINAIEARTDIRIEQAKNDGDIDIIRSINSRAYESLGLPAAQGEALYGVTERILSPETMHFIAYLEGSPVATVMILFTRNVACIGWVGTVASARGQGVASHMVKTVSNKCFDEGARLVHLQASTMGRSIYEKMGYQTFDRWKLYCADISRI